MVSPIQLQKNIYKLLQIAWTDGIEIEVGYKGRVFAVSIAPNGNTYKRRTWTQKVRSRPRRDKKGKVLLVVHNCKECGYMEIEGICVNSSCPQYNGRKFKKDISKRIASAD